MMNRALLTVVLIAPFWALVARAEDNTLIIERSRARSGVGPDFVDKAEKELDRGDLQHARQHVQTAIQSDPTYWPAFYTRAKILYRDGNWSAAINDCNELLRQDSTFVPAAILRSTANIQLGNYDAASKELDHLILLQPRLYYFARALDARAWFRATCRNSSFRNPKGAVDDAKKACAITQWKEAEPMDTLATACAASADFDSAIRYEQQAMRGGGARDMQKTLQAHLAMFQQHRQVSSR